jgi:hypothetical protein
MNELTPVNGSPPTTMVTLISDDAWAAIAAEAVKNKDFNVANFQLLVETRERMLRDARAYAAEQAYNTALAVCQAEMPAVSRNTGNKHTQSKYAKLEQVIDVCKPIWTKNGFSVTFHDLDAKHEGNVRIAMEVRHCGGYVVRPEREGPTDMAGVRGNSNKTPIQGDQSARSYMQRTMLLAFWGIAQEGADDDGNMGRDDPENQYIGGDNKKQPPNKTNKPAPLPPLDANSYLGKVEKALTGAPHPKRLKLMIAAAEKCPTIAELNQFEKEFGIDNEQPDSRAQIKAAIAASRKRLLSTTSESGIVDRQLATNSDSDKASKFNRFLVDDYGEVLGEAYSSRTKFAEDFVEIWRVADNRDKVLDNNADAVADARTDAVAAKMLAGVDKLPDDQQDEDQITLTVGVPLKNGKQDWAGYRKEMAAGLRAAEIPAQWLDAQRERFPGVPVTHRALIVKDLLPILAEKNIKAPDWLAGKAPPPAAKQEQAPDPDETKANGWIKDLREMPIDTAGRKKFDALVMVATSPMRTTMLDWMKNKKELFDRVNKVVKEVATKFGIE